MLRYTTPRSSVSSSEFGVIGSSTRNPELETRNWLSLNTDHLLDLGDDRHQVFLVLHHRFDRFVSAGNFIQYARVLATFNARGLLREIFTSEVTLRCSTRHLAASAVRARVEALSQAAPLNDERFRAHRSGNNAVHVFVGIDGAL